MPKRPPNVASSPFNMLFAYSFIPLLPPRLHRLLAHHLLRAYIPPYCRGLDFCLPVFLFFYEEAKRNYSRVLK